MTSPYKKKSTRSKNYLYKIKVCTIFCEYKLRDMHKNLYNRWLIKKKKMMLGQEINQSGCRIRRTISPSINLLSHRLSHNSKLYKTTTLDIMKVINELNAILNISQSLITKTIFFQSNCNGRKPFLLCNFGWKTSKSTLRNSSK